MKTLKENYIYIILVIQLLIVLYLYCKPFRTSSDTYNTKVETHLDISMNTYNYYYNKADSIKQDGTLIKL